MQFKILLLLATYICYASAVDFDFFVNEFKEAVKNKSKAHRGAAPEAELLLSEPYGLTRLSLDKPARRMVMRDPSVGGIAYHLGRDRLYWSDLGTGTIFARPLRARGFAVYERETLVERSPRVWRPRAIAVDHVADRLYVLDARGRKVHAFDLGDSRKHAVVYEGEFFAPMDLALDPYEGVMFIADGNKILRVDMDGGSPVVIASYPKYRIKSVALDLASKRVIWADAKFHRVKSADYDGAGLRVLLKNEPSSPGRRFALLGPANLAYHRGRVYVYDEVRRHIASFDASAGDDGGAATAAATYRVVYDRIHVKAMKMIAAERQTPAANPCGADNGRCDNLCVIAAKRGAPDGPAFTCV